MRLSLLSIFIFISCSLTVIGQAKTIAGKIVLAEGYGKKAIGVDFYELPLTIYSKNYVELGITDDTGNFDIKVNDSIVEFIAGFVGFDSEVIEISEACDYYEIILLPYATYDFISLKRAARLREKERRVLPKIYKIAYEQGLFKNEIPCR